MKGRKSLANILLEWMESGRLVKRNYTLPEDMKKICTEPRTFERYNRMAKLLIEARGRELREFDAMIDEAFELWIEIEPAFPVVLEKDVEMLVRRNIGFVDLRRCAEIAMRIGRLPPIKFSDALDMARRCDSFREIKDNSMNKILSRVLRYLKFSGLLIKTWASGSKGRKVRSMYFRIYRVIDRGEQKCGECHFIRDIRELLRRIEELYSDAVRGSKSPDNSHHHAER